MPVSSHRARLLVALGLAPLLAAFPLYRLAVPLQKLVSLPRFLGTLELAAFILAVVAIASVRVPAPPRLAGWLRSAVFAGVLANMALVGLAVYYNNPAYAPRPMVMGSAVLTLCLSAIFARKDAADQALTLRTLAGFGLVPMAALALAWPYVAVKAAADQPRNPAAPTPPAQAEVLPGAPKRIVLVTFDELRRRSTSLDDPTLDTTPQLQAIAGESVRFTNCHAAGDQTIVSMPTVLSGLRPPTIFTKVHNSLFVVREGSITGLAGFLKAAGYRTAYSTMLIQPRSFGMRDEYDDGWTVLPNVDNPYNGHAFVPVAEILREAVPKRFTHRRVSPLPYDIHPIYSVVEEGLAMYRAPAERSFLWVHMGLPHRPYYRIPKSDIKKVIRPMAYPRVHPFLNGHLDDPAFYEAYYNDYLRFSDDRFGDLVAGMRATPEWKDTLLIVSSDHGTRLVPSKPGPYGVGEAPEDITHVPLLIHRPGQTASQRIDTAVGHEDLVPTILSEVYAAPPSGFPGESILAPSLSPDRIAYTWAVSPLHDLPSVWRHTVAAYQGGWKVVQEYPAGTSRLIDWRHDPDGLVDRRAEHVETAKRLEDWLNRELAPSVR